MTRAFLPPPHTPARRGAFWVYAVVIFLVLREVADFWLMLSAGVQPDWPSAVRVVVTLALAYGLYRGSMWVRMLLIVLALIACAFVLAAIMSHPWSGTSLFAVFVAVVYLAVAVVLAFAPAVRAYEAWRQGR